MGTTSNLCATFYDGLSKLASPGPSPTEVLQGVVELWAATMDCKWSSLRLRQNEPATAWELVAAFPKEYIECNQPKHLSVKSKLPVVEYAYRTQTPQFVENQEKWERRHLGDEFTVTGLSYYQKLGAKCFLTIPFPISKDGDACQLRVLGAICCHFSEFAQLAAIRQRYSDEALKSMANLSASIIRAAFERKRYRLLIELNQLASAALTHISKNPRLERKIYLRGVAKLSMSAINCRAVSVFYRVPFLDEVSCVFSTGLVDSQGMEVPAGSIANCRYAKFESRTGTVFATCKPIFLTGDDQSNDKSKFIEVFPEGSKSQGSAILQPIPGVEKNRNDGLADGVIRCVGRLPRPLAVSNPDFDILEIQTLEFIAQQVAPVLQTLATRIQREDQVNTLRHDLLVPACMVRDGVEELQDAFGHNANLVGIDPYLLSDLSVTTSLLTHLIDQLDAEPGKMEFIPKPTWLEADIIARQKSMLKHYAESANKMKIDFGNFGQIPKLLIDRNLVDRAFFNLVVNAIKYGAEGSTITIRPHLEFVRVVGHARSAIEYHIDFENFGIGVSASEADRIFERYFRSKTAIRKESGLGLGLYISRACIEKNGGKLILSNLSNPTRFTVVFPSSCRA